MKIEEFIWTNRAFIEYGKLRGLETFEQTMADLFEIVALFTGHRENGDQLKLEDWERIASFMYSSHLAYKKSVKKPLEVTEDDFLETAKTNPELMGNALKEFLESLPKVENKGASKYRRKNTKLLYCKRMDFGMLRHDKVP